MGSPVAGWRNWLAYRVVAGHGLGMFVLFTTPIGLFLLDLSGDHPGSAVLAAGLSVVGFVSVLGVGGRCMRGKRGHSEYPRSGTLEAALRMESKSLTSSR